MNTMKIPGFTAANCLYLSGTRFTTAYARSNEEGSLSIAPQLKRGGGGGGGGGRHDDCVTQIIADPNVKTTKCPK